VVYEKKKWKKTIDLLHRFWASEKNLFTLFFHRLLLNSFILNMVDIQIHYE